MQRVVEEVLEMFTCEGCGTAYQPVEETSLARVYVKDSRCNHVEARCSHCGVTEVIYLGPHRIEEVVLQGGLQVSVFAEATSSLRIRAEKAWAAAEAAASVAGDGGPGVSETPERLLGQPQVDAGATVTKDPPSYELTPRQEQMLVSFGESLSKIPDELLWDGLQGEHRGDLPPRWID